MRPHHRPHFVATAVLVGLTGAVTGLAAAGRIGPFDTLASGAQQTVSAHVPSAPLRADSLFPPPTHAPVVHEQIMVADPQPPAQHPAPTSEPTPVPESPTPAPTASPTPEPCDDGDCGGGGDG